MEFVTNVEGEPGRPDLWLTDKDIPIFVHGCFWHRHDGCKRASTPKKNRDFWVSKFAKNKDRDVRILHQLEGLGYNPVTIWQCETTDEPTLKELLIKRIEDAES